MYPSSSRLKIFGGCYQGLRQRRVYNNQLLYRKANQLIIGMVLNLSIGVSVRGGKLSIYEGERLLIKYVYVGTWKPYFYPVNGPGGNVVRGIDGREHHNQYGLSLAYGGHGEGGSTNIWSDYDEPPYGPCGRIIHKKFDRIEIDGEMAVFAETVEYIRPDEEIICEERRAMTVQPLPGNELTIDFKQEIGKPKDPGDNPFIIYSRVADWMRIYDAINRKRPENPGRIENSRGNIGEEATRGVTAEWCDYSGQYGGEWTGIAIMQHPDNPNFPGAFFTREYGLFSLSHRFPKDKEEMILKHQVYVHRGDAKSGKVEKQFQLYISSP